MVYTYSGTSLNYSPNDPPFTTYGTHVIAQLSIPDGILSAGFTGTLNGTQFTALIGTDTYPLTTAGDWSLPGMFPPLINSAFVTFSGGAITDWTFGAVYSVAFNQVTIGTAGTGETIRPFPRVVGWGTAGTGVPGTWTLQAPPPVPLPAPVYLLVTGLAALGALRRGAASTARVARAA